MEGKAGIMQTLAAAQVLLTERGWVATNAGPTPFGPDTGPLTVLQALWRGTIYGEGLCAPDMAGSACDMLCRTLGGDTSLSFVVVGEWSRVAGRTQEEVLALFRRVIRDADRRLLAAIADAMAEGTA